MNFHVFLIYMAIYLSIYAQNPIANFNASPLSGNKPLTVYFTDNSTPGDAAIIDWQWEFGDGGIIVGQQNPSYIYNEAGVYTVILTIRDAQDRTDSEIKTNYITVNGPKAQFTAEPRGGLAPLIVNFTDQSSPGNGSITSWFWEFGDGSTSTLRNPTHTYNLSGQFFSPKLTVTNSAGIADSEQRIEYVNVVEPLFSGVPREGTNPLTVTFSDTSKPNSSAIASWLWNFGDGSTSVIQNPSHTYIDTGSYTVRLTLTDTLNQTAFLQKTNYIFVSSDFISSSALPSYTHRSPGRLIYVPIIVDMTESPYKLGSFNAQINWNPEVLQYSGNSGIQSGLTGNINTAGAAEGQIIFNGISALGATGMFEIIEFYFQVVGQVGANTNIDLSYNEMTGASTFKNLLPYVRITDGFFTVVQRPIAQFDATPLRAYEPASVAFTDQTIAGTGTINSWQWDFGDGNVSSLQNTTHQYELADDFPDPFATFDVRLIVLDEYNESDTLAKINYITIDRSFKQNIINGWNLIGLPVRATKTNVDELYPEAFDNTLFGWNGRQYIQENNLKFGEGYWLQFQQALTKKIPGPPDYDRLDTLLTGWNLFSGVSGNVSISDIYDPKGIIVPGTWFGWNGQYIAPDTLKPGKGYWVQANDSAQIAIYTDDQSYFEKKVQPFVFDLEQFPHIEIIDAQDYRQKLYFNIHITSPYSIKNFSLPPIPPGNAFDARFIENYRVSELNKGCIRLQTEHLPITIIARLRDKGAIFIIKEQNSYTGIKLNHLGAGDLFKLESLNSNVLEIELVENNAVENIPGEFIVEQNFPNPFNLGTKFRYGIPKKTWVTIKIYNSLGQLVRILLADEKEPGYYEMAWDSKNEDGLILSSGVYYTRIYTKNQSKIVKMLLIK